MHENQNIEMMFVFNVSLVFQGKFQDERIGEESEPKKKANVRSTLNGMKENYDKSDVFSVFVVLCHVLGLSISSERETNEKKDHVIKKASHERRAQVE